MAKANTLSKAVKGLLEINEEFFDVITYREWIRFILKWGGYQFALADKKKATRRVEKYKNELNEDLAAWYLRQEMQDL